MALAWAATMVAPAALAQSNATLLPNAVMGKIGASDISAMMGELGVATELIAPPGSGPVVVATAPGGGKFVFHPMACEDTAKALRCSNVVVTTAFANTGLSYDDLNAFNGEAVVTAAVNVPQEQMVVLGRNIIVLGGHSRELFKTTVYLFLVDVEKFVARQGSAASVAFSQAPRPGSKIESMTAGGKAASSAFGFSDLSAEVSAAISNTRGVRFTAPEAETPL